MKNKEYWADRALYVMKTIYNNQEKINKKLIELYEKQLEELSKDIAVIYQKLDLTRTETYDLNRLLKVEEEISKRIKELGKQEEKLDAKILKEAYKEVNNILSKSFKELYGISFNEINKEAIEKAILYPWSGLNFSKRIWKNKSKLALALEETIVRGITRGESYYDMSSRLSKLMNKSLKQSMTLIRTETANIVNTASIDRYKEYGIKKVQWITAADERTCKDCGPMDMETFDVDKCPSILHPNCRCTIIPVID